MIAVHAQILLPLQLLGLGLLCSSEWCVNNFYCSTGPGSVTLCATNTCGEHGTCVIDNHNVSSCVCKSGYGGNNCNETVDKCLAAGGCANGGRCVLTTKHFNCECTPGWNPELQCQHPLTNVCIADNPPCKNGASCTVPVPYVSGPKLFCKCTPGMLL